MFLPDGSRAVRRCRERGRRGAVVSGNDQRVAVVIFKHACLCVYVCLSLTGLSSADGSIMTVLIYNLSLSSTHSTSFLPFSLNTPPSNSFLHTFSASLSFCQWTGGPESCLHNCQKGTKEWRREGVKMLGIKLTDKRGQFDYCFHYRL